MDNHDNGKSDLGMMLMMLFCCAVLPLAILLLGGAGLASGSSKWFIFGLMGVFMVGHFIMMARSHGKSGKEHGPDGTGNGDAPHSGHGCH